MDCFEQGKTIDDFEAFVDREIKEFFGKISFNALIPYYETAIRTNRYTHPFFEKNTEQEQMLIEYLSQQAEITQNNGIFYLN